MAVHQSQWGAKLGPRIAMLVVQAIAYAHVKLHDTKHRLAMAVFHSISNVISDEVHETMDGIFQTLHDSLPDDSLAKPSTNFMRNKTGQLGALAGTGLQASGLLSSIATIMNNELAVGVYDTVRSNPHMLPDVGAVAQMIASQRIDAAEGVDAIAAQGIDNGWAQQLVSMATNFPAMTDALDMLRRGIITSDQLALWGALNSIPEDVVGLYLQLKDSPVSVADAALAVLRGNITQAQGETIASENGFTADSFQMIVDNTGEPPGTDQLLEAYRRGFIDKATLERGILQSRYRDEWIPTIEALRYSPMSTADAVDAVIQNHLTADQATSIADQNGLTPGVVDTLIETAGEPLSRTEMSDLYNRGLATQAEFDQALNESRLKPKYTDLAFQLRTRILQPAELSRAVFNGVLDSKSAVTKAMEVGYSADDATLLVNSDIASKTKSYRDAVVTAIDTLYLDGIISQSDATSGIVAMGYSTMEASLIVQAADFRRQATVITTAVHGIRTKYLGHHITTNQATGYLNSMGLPSAQVSFLTSVWEIEAGAYTKLLTETQIVQAVGQKLITANDGLARLVALGYSTGDATLLMNGA
jgi:hypothetical protein